MNPIRLAIEAVGGRQMELAKAINVSPQQLNQWVKGKRPIPPSRCMAIEKATQGRITAYILRPDVFGPPQTEAA